MARSLKRLGLLVGLRLQQLSRLRFLGLGGLNLLVISSHSQGLRLAHTVCRSAGDGFRPGLRQSWLHSNWLYERGTHCFCPRVRFMSASAPLGLANQVGLKA